jgi:hypothetical protein
LPLPRDDQGFDGIRVHRGAPTADDAPDGKPFAKDDFAGIGLGVLGRNEEREQSQ